MPATVPILRPRLLGECLGLKHRVLANGRTTMTEQRYRQPTQQRNQAVTTLQRLSHSWSEISLLKSRVGIKRVSCCWTLQMPGAIMDAIKPGVRFVGTIAFALLAVITGAPTVVG